jgi:hypothetical protein
MVHVLTPAESDYLRWADMLRDTWLHAVASVKVGRTPVLDPELVKELQTKLESHLRVTGKPKKQECSIPFVRDLIKDGGLSDLSDLTIKRKIIRPVHQKLYG